MFNAFTYNSLPFNTLLGVAAVAVSPTIPIILEQNAETIFISSDSETVMIETRESEVYIGNSKDQPITLSNDSNELFL